MAVAVNSTRKYQLARCIYLLGASRNAISERSHAAVANSHITHDCVGRRDDGPPADDKIIVGPHHFAKL